jgi:hypothetical protein
MKQTVASDSKMIAVEPKTVDGKLDTIVSVRETIAEIGYPLTAIRSAGWARFSTIIMRGKRS